MADEQQTLTDPTASGDPTRDDLIAAAVAAGVPDVAEETPADPAAPAVATPADDEPRLTRLLREREKGMKEREDSRNYAEEQRAEIQRERERIIAEAKEQARADFASEQAALRERARTDPMGTLQALGGGDDLADALIKSTTPEGKELLRMRAELAETKKQIAAGGGVKQEWDAFKANQAKAAEQQAIADAKQRFMSVATKETAPYLHARYEPEEILARANAKAIELRDGGMKLGKDFDFNDIVQYLETESRNRLGGLGSLAPAQQVRAEAVSTPQGNASKVPASGPRTITASASGERRATPKPFHELTREQQRAALIEEAEAAMKAEAK